MLDLPTPKEMTISPYAFTNMKILRILIWHEVHISSQGPVSLPNGLRCLEWPNTSNLEFGPEKLVRLHLKNSHIKQLGNFQFYDCKSLASVPDLSSAPNLESLDILSCTSLAEVHQSVGDLDKLKLLSVCDCSNLRILPSTLKTRSLQQLHLCGCSKLEKHPGILERTEHLKHFEINGMAIKELPASIENLVSVEPIGLEYCKNLTRLPLSIHKLKNLRTLYLWNCLNLAMFPKNLENSIDPKGDLGFPSLTWLDLHDCNLSEAKFLENASNCPKLTYLNLFNNKFTHLLTFMNKYDYWKDLFVYKCKQCEGVNVADVSSLKVKLSIPQKKKIECLICVLFVRQEVGILVNGREMPKWILHCEEDSISSMKCIIIIRHIFFHSNPILYGWYISHAREREREEKLLQNDWSHFQVCFKTQEESIKKCGFHLICEQREDDLRVHFPTRSANGNKLEFQGKILEDNSQWTPRKKIV
ncbi:LOW QUALITY PROTEIN: hypothetical protein BT93_C0988 [Corymbia citriodora subsp. variegata]|nr:LOW QUALITY PROTEIN: hypothetical protein BT93_C0988 [Corymbia citriodora subsp. variegata]